MDSMQSYPRSRSGRGAYYKGLAQDSLGRSEEALKALSQFLETSGQLRGPHGASGDGRMLESTGQSQKALEILERLSGSPGPIHPRLP
jgi:tetratricopeptide (TPR) repeat protein